MKFARLILLLNCSVFIMLLASCSSNDVTNDKQYSIGYLKNETIITKMLCYYFDYPGQNSLHPIDGRYIADNFTYEEYLSGNAMGNDVQYIKGVIPIGTKIRFLGVYTESSYMSDTHIRYYGKILEGEFFGKEVSIGALVDANETYIKKQ